MRRLTYIINHHLYLLNVRQNTVQVRFWLFEEKNNKKSHLLDKVTFVIFHVNARSFIDINENIR